MIISLVANNGNKGNKREMNRKVRVTASEYAELKESQDWCLRHGYNGLVKFYEDKINYLVVTGRLDKKLLGYKEEEENYNE